MLNKKGLLLGAVVVALYSNVGAAEVNGLKFGGLVGFGYTYTANKNYLRDGSDLYTNRGSNNFAVSDETRVDISKDLGEGLSIATQFRATGLRVASLNYTDGTNSISIGKDYYAVSGFNDTTSSDKSASYYLGGLWDGYGEGGVTGDYTYGVSYALSSEGLSFTLGYGYSAADLVRGKLEAKDLIDNNDSGNNKLFGNKDNKINTVGARVDFSVDDSTRVGGGAAYSITSLDSNVSIVDKIIYANVSVDASYAADGLFALVSGGYKSNKTKYINANGEDVTINKLFAVAALLYGINGEFDTSGSVVKADNFVYGGLQYQYSNEKDDMPLAVARKEYAIGLILGYAPVDNVVVDAYAGLISNKANVLSINDGQSVLYSINTRISF
ncbi:MAG: hypothetical protein LBC92_02520 [Rickettsiales bacterium]|jgi:hypothetical protein|nr:hypothetical protein [Rickettsiales bacterium]